MTTHHFAAALRALPRHGRQVLAAHLPVPVRLSNGALAEVPRLVARQCWLGSGGVPPDLAAALQHYQGGDVADIGAAQGAYTFAMAPLLRPGDTVLAVEPFPPHYAQLLDALATLTRLIPSVRCTGLPFPVGDGTPVTMVYPLAGNGIPRFGHGDTVPVAGAPSPNADIIRTLPSLRFDDLAGALGLKPRLVKIDVEGAELAVLRGAAETLRRDRPVVLLEIHPAWQPADVAPEACVNLLHEQGYTTRTLSRNDLQWQVLAIPGN